MPADLKYHQATLDLLTQQTIDPAPYLQSLDQREIEVRASRLEMLLREESPLAYSLPLFSFPEEYRVWATNHLRGIKPGVSVAKVEMLNVLEHRLGVNLPASFREWYSLNIGLSMLCVNDSWFPRSFYELGEDYVIGDKSVKLQDSNVMVFMEEHQFGEWCIRLDEGDDPPVHYLQNVSWNENPPVIQFRQDSPHFSDFVYCFLWDWFVHYNDKFSFSMLLFPGNYDPEPFQELSLSNIRNRFKETPQQWFSQHRFFNDTQRFSFPIGKTGHFHAYAEDENALHDLIYSLWGKTPPLQNPPHGWGIMAQNDKTQAAIERLKLG